jgi:hypothetical protein
MDSAIFFRWRFGHEKVAYDKAQSLPLGSGGNLYFFGNLGRASERVQRIRASLRVKA